MTESVSAEDLRKGDPQRAQRPRRAAFSEAGALLLVVAAPVVFVPLSRAPFVNIKLALVAMGVLLMWMARPALDRRLGALVGLWLGCATLAFLVSVDRWTSLLGIESQGVGLVTLWACGVALLAALAFSEGLVDRVPTWLIATGIVVSVVGVYNGLFPEVAPRWLFGLPLTGSTFGQVVHTAPFCAAAILAVLAKKRPWWVETIFLVVLTSGLSMAANRSSWVGLGLGLMVVLLAMKVPLPRATRVLATVVVVLVMWTVTDFARGTDGRYSAARRFNEGATLSARLNYWEAGLGAWRERPVTGWGPGNTWGAYLSTVEPKNYREATRGLGDVHNLFLESAVTTGLLGFASLALLAGATGLRILRGRRELSWAAAVTVALLVSQLLQPMHTTITPLLFLFAGIAARAPIRGAPLEGVSEGERLDGRRVWAVSGRKRLTAWSMVGVLLAGGFVLATLRTAAGLFEGHGNYYGDRDSLVTALRLEPQRIYAAEALARHDAVRWRELFDSPEQQAKVQASAREYARRAVRQHPRDPSVRLVAADIELIMDDPARADAWFKEQLDRFPIDTLALQGRAQVALLARDWERAKIWADLALKIQPRSRVARRFIREAESGMAATTTTTQLPR